jgi:hypothetical protein
MRVSLKKAAALASALAAISVSIPTGVAVSIYAVNSDGELQALVHSAIEQQKAALIKSQSISGAVYSIRMLIGQANGSKINALVTERAAIDKQLQIVNSVTLVEKQPDIAALGRQLAALAEAPQETYRGRSDSLVISIPNADLVTPELKALKKRRIAVEDELAHLNFTTEIELPDDVVTILRENDLI